LRESRLSRLNWCRSGGRLTLYRRLDLTAPSAPLRHADIGRELAEIDRVVLASRGVASGITPAVGSSLKPSESNATVVGVSHSHMAKVDGPRRAGTLLGDSLPLVIQGLSFWTELVCLGPVALVVLLPAKGVPRSIYLRRTVGLESHLVRLVVLVPVELRSLLSRLSRIAGIHTPAYGAA